MPPFDVNESANTQPEPAIIDPADEHFEQSIADFEDYDRAVSNNEFSLEYLVEPNYEQLGDRGNPWSRQGFDFDSFRERT